MAVPPTFFTRDILPILSGTFPAPPPCLVLVYIEIKACADFYVEASGTKARTRGAKSHRSLATMWLLVGRWERPSFQDVLSTLNRQLPRRTK
jgi:hypothetical protein